MWEITNKEPGKPEHRIKFDGYFYFQSRQIAYAYFNEYMAEMKIFAEQNGFPFKQIDSSQFICGKNIYSIKLIEKQ